MLNHFDFSALFARVAGWFGESQPTGFDKNNPWILSALSDLLAQCPLSSLLPYETYDPEPQIFINKRSWALCWKWLH